MFDPESWDPNRDHLCSAEASISPKVSLHLLAGSQAPTESRRKQGAAGRDHAYMHSAEHIYTYMCTHTCMHTTYIGSLIPTFIHLHVRIHTKLYGFNPLLVNCLCNYTLVLRGSCKVLTAIASAAGMVGAALQPI